MFRRNSQKQGANIAFTMGNGKHTGRKKATVAPADAKALYKREILNLARCIRLLKTEQENMAGCPLTDAQTSEITDAIDSGAYVSKEIEMAVKIRDLEKKLDCAKKRFHFLFDDY